MDTTTEFCTFDEMVAVLSRNALQALVQDWWSRLERAIRDFCARRGEQPRERISDLISKRLPAHSGITVQLIHELHEMRMLRNAVAHGDAPPLTAREAEAYARRAWEISWYLVKFDELKT